MKDEDILLPEFDHKQMLPYHAIRYIAGYPESYVKKYACAAILADRERRALSAASHPQEAALAQPQAVAWQAVVQAIRAVGAEASRRGEMFPQTSDEQQEDRQAASRVTGMIEWYATKGGAVAERLSDWPKVAAAPAQPAQEGRELALEPDDVEDFARTVEEFGDTGETMTDDSLLMKWANAGLLECTHYEVTPKGQQALDAALKGERHEG